MTNTNILAIASPGSRALKNAKYEKYCRLRALAQPRIQAYREVGWGSREDDVAYINACRLERRPEIRDRIAYLTRREEDLITEKRQRIEERLWAIHEANIQDFFITEDGPNLTEPSSNPTKMANNPDQQKVAVSSRARVVPRPLTELDPETAKLIEDITIDSKGRAVPKLYNKLQASKELRAMLNLSAKSEAPDVTKLSDSELIEQLARQAKELGISIDLNYSFAKPKKTDE
jgi:hypothetical protein